VNAAQAWSTILGGIIAAFTLLGFLGRFFIRPLKKLSDDLAPLTDKNSDGHSVFTDMRAQLQQLVDEFPKNGVPTRTALDAVKLDVATLLTKQTDIISDLSEVRADVRAHQMLHRSGFPTQRDNRRGGS
jgi:hypothetical protein